MLTNRKPALLSLCLLTILGISIGSGVTNAAQSVKTPATATESSTKANNSAIQAPPGAAAPAKKSSTKASTPTTQAPTGAVMPAKAALNKVKVFFPKNPKSMEDYTYVEPVVRTTGKTSLAGFAIEQLIAGPTTQEKTSGLFNPIKLEGKSNCGSDFSLDLSKAGVAKLKFCKKVIGGGTLDDARTKMAIDATLKQFSNISSVIVLDTKGNCLNDQSGENVCLKKTQNTVKLTEQSKLAINGIGPVDLGMTVAEASTAAGVQLVSLGSKPSAVCSEYKPASGLNGVRFMVAKGKIARIDIDSKAIATVSGAKIGDTESRTKSLYSGQLQVSRLPNSTKGKYLTFVPKTERDKNLRLMFETDGQTVRRIRVGKLPEVGFIEGCLDVRPD